MQIGIRNLEVTIFCTNWFHVPWNFFPEFWYLSSHKYHLFLENIWFFCCSERLSFSIKLNQFNLFQNFWKTEKKFELLIKLHFGKIKCSFYIYEKNLISKFWNVCLEKLLRYQYYFFLSGTPTTKKTFLEDIFWNVLLCTFYSPQGWTRL